MIHIVKAGLLTTIQDLGRYGYQKHGVIASGVMDSESHRIANLLVGNSPDLATMEITLMGPVIEFQDNALISICGGNLSPMINGDSVPMWRPIFIKKGSELRFGNPKQGFRSYLAIAGGFDVPLIMESRSTYLRAEIGGYQGRALEKGDELNINHLSEVSARLLERLEQACGKRSHLTTKWFVASEFTPVIQSGETIRIIEGREYGQFTKESQKALTAEDFQIDSKSDRMGYRLNGPQLKRKKQVDMVSEAVAFGTIQVPAEGNPIVLLADRQTTGGYPKIAQVVSIDLPKVAQMKPGERIRFEMISLEKAQQLYLERERALDQLTRGLAFKMR
ncbi:biotin-dependent carboxyltransferase family protein [Halobacillus sp. BBL2006]|uniref:5-oxoprolinase subunit C family protein n=1 Tax=Halobacillus sp. BBL2006 TaxID=1543706 RepID=UPI000541F7F0|nr:biotin-dependent carboxyltransferase family protein [Halobacillus sp. BBL2006]KHE67294.1 KipI antagonist [Halobacillus sp. BBL2006]